MDCHNHPGTAATGVCTGCAESFCQNCLVEIGGQKYCGSCKVMALKAAPDVEVAKRPCDLANQALTYSIVGIFCFGIILEPIALIKANRARKQIAADPTLAGSGKVTAATIIACCVVALWILGILARVSMHR